MYDEEFDGSAMRELLAPAVADRGLTSAPTDAIVAAGRRRVAGRRTAVAGGALAIVAAVPLAATAIAAGPGNAGATGAAGTTSGPGAGTATSPQSHGTTTAWAPAQGPATGDPSGLPRTPFQIAAGTVEGRHFTVTAQESAGNNALTAKDKCLGLTVKVDGHYSVMGPGPLLPYCFPLPSGGPKGAAWADQELLKYDFTGGAGTLQMGMVSSDVAKIVAHVDGLAPVTATTVPAPGLAGQAFYFLPIPKDDYFRVSFDEYDAKGTKTGSFNNWTPPPGVPAGPGAKH